MMRHVGELPVVPAWGRASTTPPSQTSTGHNVGGIVHLPLVVTTSGLLAGHNAGGIAHLPLVVTAELGEAPFRVHSK